MEKTPILGGRGIGELRMSFRSTWAHSSSVHRLDPQNVDHLFMKFYVEGENGKATVRLEMTKVRVLSPGHLH